MDNQLALQDDPQLATTTAIVIFGGPIIVSAGALLAVLLLPGPSAVLVAGLKVLAILVPRAGGIAQSVVTYASGEVIALVTFATLVVESLCASRRAFPEQTQTVEEARSMLVEQSAEPIAYCITVLWPVQRHDVHE